MSLFCCPICGGSLTPQGRSLRCAKGHCHDIAREGHVYLLPLTRKRTLQPGDDREMVDARRAFLGAGYYAPFAQRLGELVTGLCAGLPAPAVLDAGCGEGYYTAQVAQALLIQCPQAQVAGFDISKHAVRLAAKLCPQAQFAVATSAQIPVASGAVDVLYEVFSPIMAAEFARVVRPGGHMVLAVPSARHLFGLKQVLYDTPYENAVRDTDYEGFTFCRREPVRCQIEVTGQPLIHALYAMTPYFYKTPPEGSRRLAELDTLTTEIGFDFLIYRRQG